MKRLGLIGMLAFLTLAIVNAQTTAWAVYGWQAADFALRYPADWHEPIVTETENRQQLTLSHAETPAPEDVQIQLALLPISEEASDPATVLAEALAQFDLDPSLTLPLTWLNANGIQAYASSSDKQFVGQGRIVLLPGNRFLWMVGRARAADRDALYTLFETMSNSVTQSARSVPPTAGYGVLWVTQSAPVDGPNALVAPAGLMLGQDGRLYLVDGRAGLVILDAAQGSIIETHPFRAPTRILAMALGSDGTVYAADAQCQCVQRWQSGAWQTFSEGYAPNAPRSLSVDAEGALYATDVQEGRAFVRVVREAGDARLQFETPVVVQPLLASDANGQVFALTDRGDLLQVEGAGFTPRQTLQLALTVPQYNAFAFTPAGDVLLVTAQDGIVQVNNIGNETARIGRGVAQGQPLPDTFINPVGAAMAADNTVYVADSAGALNRIIALSPHVLPGRSGNIALRPGAVVTGTLSSTQNQQVWLLDASGEDVFDFAAISQQGPGLDVALRVYDPQGAELAFIDNVERETATPVPGSVPTAPVIRLTNPQDALLQQIELPVAGTYFVVVERVQGGGSYQLGVQPQGTLTLTDDTPAEMQGVLSDALPAQRIVFQGRGGQTITMTLTALDGTLDPTLILRNPRGDEVARNEDAADPALGRNAQIADFRLESNGLYTIEAARFGGTGRFVLTITLQ